MVNSLISNISYSLSCDISNEAKNFKLKFFNFAVFCFSQLNTHNSATNWARELNFFLQNDRHTPQGVLLEVEN